MLHCLHSPDDFSGKGRPGAMKWLHQSFGFPQSSQIGDLSSVLRQLPNRSVKAEDSWENAGFPPALEDHFPTAGLDFRGYGLMGFELPEVASCPPEMGHSLSRTSSCQLLESGQNSLKKRKAEVAFTEEKTKRDDEEEEESKPKEKQDETSPNAPKVSKSPKPDYIHVRARRGQATDSHSLAERARREKISKKMKYLQDLVPGCDKITGKAGMLDEIINYVQSLQRQVEFLSLKLATMNPRTEFKMDAFLGKEIPAYVAAAGFQAADGGGGGGCSSSSSEMPNLGFLQFQAMDPSPPQMTATTTNSSTSDIFTNSSASFSPFTAWETDLQTLYSGEFQ